MFKEQLMIENTKVMELIKGFTINDIWSFYIELKEEFNNYDWEIMKENEVKTLNIDTYFNEYFLFLNLLLQDTLYWGDDKLFESLNSEGLRSLVKYFDSKGFLLLSLHEIFNEFLSLVIDEVDVKEEVINSIIENNTLGKMLINMYKGKILTELEKYKKNAIVLDNIWNDIDNINKKFEDWAFKDFYKNTITKGSNKIIVNHCIESEIDVESYGEKVVRYGMNLADTIIAMYEKYLIDVLNQFTEKLDLNIRDTDKNIKIINYLQVLEDKYDLVIDSKITSSSFEQKLLIFKDEAMIAIEDCHLRLEKIKQSEFEKLEAQFYLDRRLLELFNFNLSIKLKELSDELIEKKLNDYKKEKNIYAIPTHWGEISLILNREEAVEYVKNKYYTLQILLNGEIGLLSEKIGCIVRLTY